MDRLGVGWELLHAVNPKLIYASSSGYGRDGPYAAFPAMDLTIQAMGGVMHTTGFADRPPVKAGPAMADFFAGIHTSMAQSRRRSMTVNTLAWRVASSVSMQDAVYASLSSSLGMYWSTKGESPARTGEIEHGGLAESPYNVYPTSDGFHRHHLRGRGALGVPSAGLMDQTALADDPRFSSLKGPRGSHG